MLASLRLDGSTAGMTIEGATDTEVFQTYVREVLCPTLRPGDLVVMDMYAPPPGAGRKTTEQWKSCYSRCQWKSSPRVTEMTPKGDSWVTLFSYSLSLYFSV